MKRQKFWAMTSLAVPLTSATILFTNTKILVSKVNNYMRKPAEKTIKYPEITTVWPINDRADTQATLGKIKDKLQQYQVISAREQAFLDKHSPTILA